MGEHALPIRSPPELALAGRLLSDERLARLVSRGSERAFGALYQRHHQALYRYCRSIVRDEDDAQDALQSAMMRALVALRAEGRDLAVRPWLFRIVHNEAVSVLRRRCPTVALVEHLEPADFAVERTLEGRERLGTLLADLQALPERQRSALVMRELSGLSIGEIAGVLSTSPGATKQVLFEARRALQEFAEGRAMECEQVRRVISDGDRRVLRGRKLRGHLRECSGCRDFQVAISARVADLRALAPPLPGMAAATMLARLLAHGTGGGHTGGLAVGSGTAVGSSAAASLTVKALAGVATVTVAVAGGTHFAIVHRQHDGRPVVRSHARPAPFGLPTESMRADASQGAAAPPVVSSSGEGPRAALVAPEAAPHAASVHHKASLRGPARSPGVPVTFKDHKNTGSGPSRTQQGHGKATAEGRGVAHRSHGGGAGARRSGSSRPVHGDSGKRERAPVQSAKPGPGHGRGQAETDRLPARAPSVPRIETEEAGTPGQEPTGRSGSSRAGSGAEGRGSSAAVPDRPHSG
jgi:RNA polymerase sigma factor (sigma-70 family)